MQSYNQQLKSLIALKLYYAEHHNYPNSLSQLVPNYLSEVFRNPMTGSTMKLLKLPKQLILIPPTRKHINTSSIKELKRDGVIITIGENEHE
jgi:hypothetical protein